MTNPPEANPNPENQRAALLAQKAMQAYETDDFAQANEHMAELANDILGAEAADALQVTDDEQRTRLQAAFSDAGRTTLNAFRDAFDAHGAFRPENEAAYWAACDTEGPTAKASLGKALEAIKLSVPPEQIRAILNNVAFEDAAVLAIDTLRENGTLEEENADEAEAQIIALCEDPDKVRELLERVVPTTDYYYDRIRRTEKINDESILKFNRGAAHGPDDLTVINLGLRLANATWLVAQRHAAKKDGNTDRIDPTKRNGVFNTPDTRQLRQFAEAREQGLSDTEAVARVAFELCKDSWMLEDETA